MNAVGSTENTTTYLWSFPGAPIRVCLDLSLVDGIRDYLRSAQQSGGLLVGHPQGNVIHIHEVIPLASLSDETIQAALERVGPKSKERCVAGYYRSHSGEFLRLDDRDIALCSRYFPAPHSVVLLIQYGAAGAGNATFFFWDAGRMQGDFAFLEFPFDQQILSTLPQPDQTTPALDLQVEEPLEPEGPESEHTAIISVRPPRKTRRWKSLAWSIGLALLLSAGALSVVRFAGVWGRQSEAEASMNSEKGIRLSAQRIGSDFHIVWDRQSPTIASAISGSLSIFDGDKKRDISLRPSDLRSGSVLYQPTNDQIQVELSINTPEQGVTTESVFLLLPSRGKPVVQTLVSTVRQQEYPRQNQFDSKPKPKTFNPASLSSHTSDRPEITQHDPPPELTTSAAAAAQNLLSSLPNLTAERLASTGAQTPRQDQPAKTSTSDTASSPEIISSRSNLLSQATANFPTPARQAAPYALPTPIVQRTPSLTPLIRSLIRQEGSVEIIVSIDQKGVVRGTRVINRGGMNPYVVEAALNAARLWQFKPALRDGQPVPSESRIEFRFKRD